MQRRIGVDELLVDPPVGSARVTAAAHHVGERSVCLLYTSDAADERSSVDLGGRRIIKKKKTTDRSRVC